MANERIEKQRATMEALRITRNILAKETGIHYSTIYRYFDGTVKKPLWLDFYANRIDEFLSKQIARINPETDGGGE